jgi:mannosyltransferase OCH1-like enzyme
MGISSTILGHVTNLQDFKKAAELYKQSPDYQKLDDLALLYRNLRLGNQQIVEEKVKKGLICRELLLNAQRQEWYVPFNESMAPQAPDFFSLSEKQMQWWRDMKKWYEANSLAVVHPAAQAKIPKIIHQVWVGPNPFPERFKKAQESIRKFHPEWECKLWTDADVEPFGLVNKKLFDEAENYGEKSDIFRYEILDRYGGVYFDVDIECIKSFDVLHHCYEFYTGIVHRGSPGFGIGVIGCTPGHPIIQLCITSMQDNGSKIDPGEIIKRTGPLHFTHCFMQLYEQFPGKVIAFPPSYFYSIPNTARFYTIQENMHWIRPEAFTIHYWGCTWT